MPFLDLALCRSQVSLSEALQLLGWHPTEQKGTQARGPCPVHGGSEGSRTFSADLAGNRWQCFKCRAGGNSLDLWALVTHQNIYQGTWELYKRLGRPAPVRTY